MEVKMRHLLVMFLLFTVSLPLQPLGSLVQLKILNVDKTASKWL